MDQLGQKLLCTTLELEKLKSETMEEMQKTQEYVNQLVVVLKCAIRERDEARKQLENLLNKTISNSITKSDSFPQFNPIMGNSGVTESDILPETYNYCSPPVMLEPNCFCPEIEEGSLIIDSLARGRVLPQKGKFLKAVMEAGPLLQTLLVGGPLPRWRNQPQMHTCHIPPVSIRGRHVEDLGQRPTSSVGGSLMNYGGASNNDFFALGKRHRFC